jgi:hypothetical protein
VPSSTSIWRASWPDICPIRWCKEPLKPGHHHHELLYQLDKTACTCMDGSLHIPGTKPKAPNDDDVHISEAGLKLIMLSILDEDFFETGGREPTQVVDALVSLLKPYLRFDEYGELTKEVTNGDHSAGTDIPPADV